MVMETTPKLSLLCSCLLFFSLLFLPLSLCAICNPNDRAALQKILDAAGNPPNMMSAWNLAADCCRGWAITCNSDGRVTYFLAFNSNQSFQIPPAIGKLDYLQSFTFLGFPHLTGTIPRNIVRLRYLETISINECNLNGSIPTFLGEMKSLKRIYLDSNNLSGPIPRAFGHLPNLTELNLSVNKLTGGIHRNFGMLKNLQSLVLAINQLSGQLPRSLGNLNFSYIDLSNNNFTGDASFFFGRYKTALKYLSLQQNSLSFDLSNVEIPPSIGDLDLSFNNVYGRLPPSITKPFYEEFNVSYNKLCGPIPSGLQYLDDAESAFIHNACLCGSPLPPCK